MAAFLGSCSAVLGSADAEPLFQAACHAAFAGFPADGRIDSTAARAFFERWFVPHRYAQAGAAPGLLTGYYEPIVAAARAPDARRSTPLLRRPADLVNLVPEASRGAVGNALTHMRRLPSGALEPFATREQIEAGALAGQGLEIAYAEPVDVFFLQVQGSGLLRFDDGSEQRITYDGKNGHPYTSIGRAVIDAGHMSAEAMSLQALSEWLRADRERGRRTMWLNQSYAFFREVSVDEASGPLGVLGTGLHRGRSLAVDTGFHRLGTPIWVMSADLADPDRGSPPFARLMVAQDVGSAIRGRERGDIYFGSGDAAGELAGVTKHAGSFVVFVPRDDAVARKASAS